MIGLGVGRPIFLATGVTDLRYGINRLYALILDQLGQEPLSGALFCFCNRRADTVKLFCFDEGGVWLAAKRLESGTFRWPKAGTRTVQLTAADLHLLLSGVDPTRTRLRRWWTPVDAPVQAPIATPPPPLTTTPTVTTIREAYAPLSRARAQTYDDAAMETAPATAHLAEADGAGHGADAAGHGADALAKNALHARIRALEGENQRLTLRVKDLQQQLWGRKAERGLATDAAPGVLSLFEEALGAAPAADASMRAGGTARRPAGARPGPKPLDPRLPREVIALPDPPASARYCALTGTALVPGFAEQLEVLARRPAVYYVKRFERTVWVSPTKTAPVATPGPADVLPRARMHVSVIAHVAAAHYSEHLPYYRLEQQLARTGVALPRSTQVALMRQLDALVAPLVAHLRTAVLGSGYVHLDATPVDVCDPARPGRARAGALPRRRSGRTAPAAPTQPSRGSSGSSIRRASRPRTRARCSPSTAACCRPMAPRGSTRSARPDT